MHAAASKKSISKASASENGNAGVGDSGSAIPRPQTTGGRGNQQPALGQLLETFPLPGGGCIPYSEMVAIGRAYDMKIAKAESGLSEARGAFRNATGLIRTIRKKRALVQYWTVHNAGEGESELEKLLGEWATCCDRITNAIFTTKGTVLFPAQVH